MGLRAQVSPQGHLHPPPLSRRRPCRRRRQSLRRPWRRGQSPRSPGNSQPWTRAPTLRLWCQILRSRQQPLRRRCLLAARPRVRTLREVEGAVAAAAVVRGAPSARAAAAARGSETLAAAERMNQRATSKNKIYVYIKDRPRLLCRSAEACRARTSAPAPQMRQVASTPRLRPVRLLWMPPLLLLKAKAILSVHAAVAASHVTTCVLPLSTVRAVAVCMCARV